jgi:hypothetical protein
LVFWLKFFGQLNIKNFSLFLSLIQYRTTITVVL